MTKLNTGLSAACADGTAASPAIETAERRYPHLCCRSSFPSGDDSLGRVGHRERAWRAICRALPGHARAAARGRQNEMLISFGGSSRLKELRWLTRTISASQSLAGMQWPRRSISEGRRWRTSGHALPDHVCVEDDDGSPQWQAERVTLPTKQVRRHGEHRLKPGERLLEGGLRSLCGLIERPGGRDLQLVDAVAAVDVVAELDDLVSGRPGRDVGEIDRHRLGQLDRNVLAALDRLLELLAVQPGGRAAAR